MVTDFAQLGREAYAAGRMRAPALEPAVLAALEGLPVGDPAALQVMRDYAAGYDAAADEAARVALEG